MTLFCKNPQLLFLVFLLFLYYYLNKGGFMSRLIGKTSSTKDITKVPNTLIEGIVFPFLSIAIIFTKKIFFAKYLLFLNSNPRRRRFL